MIVKYFARFREVTGTERETIEIGDGCRVSDVLDIIRRKHPMMGNERNILTAINEKYAGPEDAVSDGDELAVLPQVSGG